MRRNGITNSTPRLIERWTVRSVHPHVNSGLVQSSREQAPHLHWRLAYTYAGGNQTPTSREDPNITEHGAVRAGHFRWEHITCERLSHPRAPDPMLINTPVIQGPPLLLTGFANLNEPLTPSVQSPPSP